MDICVVLPHDTPAEHLSSFTGWSSSTDASTHLNKTLNNQIRIFRMPENNEKFPWKEIGQEWTGDAKGSKKLAPLTRTSDSNNSGNTKDELTLTSMTFLKAVDQELRNRTIMEDSLIVLMQDANNSVSLHPIFGILQRATRMGATPEDIEMWRRIESSPRSAWISHYIHSDHLNLFHTDDTVGTRITKGSKNQLPSDERIVALRAYLAAIKCRYPHESISSIAFRGGGGTHPLFQDSKSHIPLRSASSMYRLYHSALESGESVELGGVVDVIFTVTGLLGKAGQIHKGFCDCEDWDAHSVFHSICKLFSNQSIGKSLRIFCVSPNTRVGDIMTTKLEDVLNDTENVLNMSLREAYKEKRLCLAHYNSEKDIPWAYPYAFVRDCILSHHVSRDSSHASVTRKWIMSMHPTLMKGNDRSAEPTFHTIQGYAPSHVVVLREGVDLQPTSLENLWMSRKHESASCWIGQVYPELSRDMQPGGVLDSKMTDDYIKAAGVHTFNSPSIQHVYQLQGRKSELYSLFHLGMLTFGSVIDCACIRKSSMFWNTIKEYVCHHKNTIALTEHEYIAEGILAQSDVALSVSIWCRNIDIQHPGRFDQKYKSLSESVTQKHDQRIKVYRCFGSPPISFHARFDTTLYSSQDYTILNKNVYEIDSDSQFHYEQIEGMPHANCVAYIQQERQRTSDVLRMRLKGWNAFSGTRPRHSTGRMVSGCLSQPVTHNSSEKDKSQFNKVHKKHVFISSLGSRTLLVYYEPDVRKVPECDASHSDLLACARTAIKNQSDRLWKPLEMSNHSCSILILHNPSKNDIKKSANEKIAYVHAEAKLANISGTVKFLPGPKQATSHDQADSDVRSVSRWRSSAQKTILYVNSLPTEERPSRIILMRDFPLWCNYFWPAHLNKFVNRYNDIAIPDYGNPFSGGVDFQIVSCRPWMLQALVNYLPDPLAEHRLQNKIAYRIKRQRFNEKELFKQSLNAVQAVLSLLPIPFSGYELKRVSMRDTISNEPDESSSDVRYSFVVSPKPYVSRRGTNLHKFCAPRIAYRSRAWYNTDRVRVRRPR